ncbi:hypothetical protein EVAR_30860_1 [Eumeta japonica]|uniref:Uncharacterized protein n=1 Tax=Eumeta variegata TaxID=151549 RepID=A0A4C1XRL2_EUMVA|nr:hypothetical protein EVAR_30860_1 [Eumeta japonica]
MQRRAARPHRRPSSLLLLSESSSHDFNHGARGWTRIRIPKYFLEADLSVISNGDDNKSTKELWPPPLMAVDRRQKRTLPNRRPLGKSAPDGEHVPAQPRARFHVPTVMWEPTEYARTTALSNWLCSLQRLRETILLSSPFASVGLIEGCSSVSLSLPTYKK